MNPQHKAMLRAAAAGSITYKPEPMRFFFDGSPVEPFTTLVVEELLHDQFVRFEYEHVEPTDAGERELARWEDR